MKTIYLHIGVGKTGTSSIQSFLSRNRNNLLELGVLYPTSGLTYNGFKSHSHHGLAVFQSQNIPQDSHKLYSELLAEIDSSTQDTVIISSEHFCYVRKSYLQELKAILSNYNIKIIFYIRNQAKLIESTFLQWQKAGWDYSGSIENFYAKHRDSFNFLQLIQPWIEAFGAKNIVTKVYDRRTIGEDLCLDFLKIFNLDNQIQSDNPKANPSLLPDFSNLLTTIDKYNISETDRKKIITDFLELSDNFKRLSYKKIISTELRNEIQNYYQESNLLVARQLLDDNDSNYFLNP